MQELSGLLKLFSETTTNNKIDQRQTKVDRRNLEPKNKLIAEHQVNETAKIPQPAPLLPKNTSPPPRVDKPI